MSQENIIVKCDRCGTKNRIPVGRMREVPICGKCKAPLKTTAPGTPIDVNDKTFKIKR